MAQEDSGKRQLSMKERAEIDRENDYWIDWMGSYASSIVSGNMKISVVKELIEKYKRDWSAFIEYFRKYEGTPDCESDKELCKEEGWTFTPPSEILKAAGL